MRCVMLPSEMKKIDSHKSRDKGERCCGIAFGRQIRRAVWETVRDAVMPVELTWGQKRRAEMADGADHKA